MKLLKLALAAGVIIAPMLVEAPTAEAYTARQYHSQGHGVYTNSTGSRRGFSRYRYYHRYYRRRYHRYY